MAMAETVQRIEPARLEEPGEAISDVTATGLLASDTPKGPVSLRFPVVALDVLFPRLFPET